MTARELTNSVRTARETDDWATAGIDERIQREVNKGRVQKTIVPYLAQHPDRFFGSFIVLAQPGSLEFEPLSGLLKDLPAAYRSQAEELGFITFGSGELIALDGQHRLMAFREVITGGAEGKYASEVGDDLVCVLLLEEESSEKTRRIFNKVNRHAKPTGRSDNIITSEDDGFALVTRRLLDRGSDAPLADRDRDGGKYELVQWTSNTLSARSTKLTTISVVYEAVQELLTYEGFQGFSERENPVAPDDATLDRAYERAAEWWDAILELEAFRNALNNPTQIPDIRYDAEHRHSLLLRPVGQIATVKGLVVALKTSKGDMSLKSALKRIDRLDFSATPDSMWRDTIVRADGRMVARKEAYDLAARLLCYLIAAEYVSDEFVEELRIAWNSARGRDPYAPVDELEEHERPQELPEPLD